MKKINEIALFTQNVEAAGDFYGQVLGTAPVYRGSDIVIFDVAGVQLLIHKKYPQEPGQPANEDHFALGVPDLAACAREIEGKGLAFELDPQTYDWGFSAYLRDPDGRLVEIHQLEK
jgi:catechol 2,3-dioxygenase-like lactoylglutathione lyase family enzyme